MYMIWHRLRRRRRRRRHRSCGHVLMVGLILIGYNWWREEATQVPPWYRRSS
jgi:hypothetical protein